MRGICSSRPGQPAIRLLLGTHLLLLVQAWLVFWSGAVPDLGLRIIVGLSATLGLSGFIAALHGGSGEEPKVWLPRRASRTGDRP